MNTIKSILVAGALVVLAGCSGPSVRYDFDSQRNFSQYKSYDWQGLPRQQSINPFMDARVKGAVEKELTGKGFRQELGGTPDFLITAYTLYQPSHSRSGFNVGLGMGFLGVGTSVGTGRHRMIGSIVMEIEDFRTRQAIWKCTKDDVLDDQESPEDADADVTKAVTAMLSKFPPK